jgi:hypothetical protein
MGGSFSSKRTSTTGPIIWVMVPLDIKSVDILALIPLFDQLPTDLQGHLLMAVIDEGFSAEEFRKYMPP